MSKTKQITKKSQVAEKSLHYYLDLNYPIIIYEEDSGYTAEIRELPGCLTQGETLQEVKENIRDARELWIETAYENGDNIPLPVTEISYSGKTLLRMPRSLHQRLAENAEIDGVSLNQYIVFLLSEQNTLRQNYRLITGKIKNMKIKGIKKGKTIVFSEEIDEISDETEITVEIPEDQIIDRQERWKKLEKGIGAWKDNPENEEEMLAKLDKVREIERSNSERH